MNFKGGQSGHWLTKERVWWLALGGDSVGTEKKSVLDLF